MDLDMGLVVSILREGKAALSMVQDRGLSAAKLAGPGKTAFKVMLEYETKYGALPDPSIVSVSAQVALDLSMPGTAAYFVDAILNRAMTRALEEAFIALEPLMQTNPAEALAVAQRRFAEIEAPAAAIDLEALRKPGEGDAELLAYADGVALPIPLPWKSLSDALGGGLRCGQLVVLVAPPGVGKTQSALCVIDSAAVDRQIPSLYVGLEARPSEVRARMLALRSCGWASWQELMQAAGRPGEADKLRELIAMYGPVLDSAPFYRVFGVANRWSYTQLEPIVAQIRRKHPEKLDAAGKPIPGSVPILIVVDYLQLCGAPQEAEIRERVGRAAGTFKEVAMKYGAAVVAISSTSREHYKGFDATPAKNTTKEPIAGTGNPRRFLNSAKEAGEVEAFADIVVAFQSEPWPDNKPPKDGTRVHLGLAKVRVKGKEARDWVHLLFDGTQYIEDKNAFVSSSDDADVTF